MTWVWTSLPVGYGVGSAVVGVLADTFGARAALTVPSACGLAVMVFAGVLGARARKAGRDRRFASAAD
ncbi:hypothetical protein [Amycolatopsis sp. NPDC051061]|uniref:hypothetical protein n=1 Tax=Amycolatopsis sp. NPDC051061 TaxID=3155042 RepID=UPI00341516D4